MLYFEPQANSTIYIPFDTIAESSGSITISGLATSDIEIYKDGSATTRASDSGYALLDTDGIDFAGHTGLHAISIDLSDNTDAGFFAVGSTYMVAIASITVDSQTVNAWVATFRIRPAETVTGYAVVDAAAISGDATAADNLELMYDGTGYTDDTAPSSRAQVDAIGASSGGALNFAANADNSGGAIDPGSTAFVGVETNNYTDTAAANGTYHIIADSTNVIDVVYGFAVGGNRTAVELTFKGFANAVTDDLTVSAYDHVGAGWEAIATLTAQAGTTDVTLTANLLSKHTGTGGELGNVYIRFNGSGLTANADLNTNQILVAAVNNNATIGYVGGAVWLDTGASNTNTESYVDGTADNPVSTIAAATTIAGNLNLTHINVASGSSITLAQGYDNWEFDASGATIALGGQSVSGAQFTGATITGNDDGTNTTATTYIDCVMGENTLGIHALKRCGLSGTTNGITLAEAGTYDWDQCFSRVAGTSTPKVTFGSGVNQNLNMRHYSGGIQVEGMGAGPSTDNMSLEGFGQIVEGTCTSGTVAIRGNFTTSGITNLTLSDDARIDVAQINAEVDTALSDYDPPTRTELTTDTNSILTRLGTPADTDIATDISNLNDISAADILNTQMTESYASDGTAPTLAQALFMIQQELGDFEINGTTITVKRLDGSTTAATFTLDSATVPTSRTRTG